MKNIRNMERPSLTTGAAGPDPAVPSTARAAGAEHAPPSVRVAPPPLFAVYLSPVRDLHHGYERSHMLQPQWHARSSLRSGL